MQETPIRGPAREAAIPPVPGTYALVLGAARDARVRIGRLGLLSLRRGCYVYVGSALGSGGLCGRISHHLRRTAAPRWHIDYLKRAAEPVEIWYCTGRTRREHDWATILDTLPGCSIALARFGASDCRCVAHLFRFDARPTFDAFRLLLPPRLRAQLHCAAVRTVAAPQNATT